MPPLQALVLKVLREYLKMGKAKTSAPWWLESGTEICSICHQVYIYETEYRCLDCDAGVCPDCVKVETNSIICIPCANYEQED